jgi:hypothetical protein
MRVLGVLGALGAAGARAPGQWAGPAPQPAATCAPCDTSALLRGLPGDTEAVVVIAGAARQRASAPGRSLEALLHDVSALPETGAAWARLAGALDWTTAQAFDELLGRRVTLVMRGLGGPADPDWALLSDVTASTERRLRERLAASPRGTCSGLPVLCVEDGAFELTIARSPDPKTDGQGLATIVLSPGPRAGAPSTLVQELALSDYVRSQRLLGKPQARPCEIVLMLRSSPRTGEPARTLSLTAVSQDDGWQAHLVCAPGMVWGVPEGRRVEEWSDAPFQAMAADALVGMMGVVGAAPAENVPSIHGLENLLPSLPGGILKPEARRAALVLRKTTLEGAGRLPAASPDAIMVSGRRPAPVAATTHAALALTVALESEDQRSLVVEGDRAVAGALCLLQNERGSAGSVCMEVGVPDAARRRIRLGDDLTIAGAYRSALESLFGPDAELTWGAGAGCGLGGRASGGADRTAWWSATLAPAGAPERRAAAAGPAPRAPAAARRRLSVGVVRPAELDRTLRLLGAGGEFFDPLTRLRRIDTLRWDAWLREDGMVEADLSLRMTR